MTLPTLSTLSLALLTQTILYWLECLIVTVSCLNHSFESLSPSLDPLTLTLTLFTQTILYWLEFLKVVLRHSAFTIVNPLISILFPLYIIVFLTTGASCIRTHVKPILLIYRAGNSKFKRDPPGVKITGRTTCLQQIKEPI